MSAVYDIPGVWCPSEMLDEALCHQTPGHELLSCEREGWIEKGAAKTLLADAGDGWFNTLLEVEERYIRLKRAAENERFKLSRENVELVSAIEQIHEALIRGVPSAAEKLAYDALAKWGRS